MLLFQTLLAAVWPFHPDVLELELRETLILTLASTVTADAANSDANQQAFVLAENWLSAQRDYKQFPRMSVADIKDQEIIFSGA
jgi:hypothetical protein